MPRGWQSTLDDLLPWLLEWENPSARYLTLRHLLDSGEEDFQVAKARAAIPSWPPVREILALMDGRDFWGRRDRPFYGGAMGTHATLHLLAELGMERTPQIEAACENLLEYGQDEGGGFTPLLCHTGNAIRTLVHFGYLGDPRLEQAFEYLVARSEMDDGLTCPYGDGEGCQWGITKALGAFAALPAAERTPQRMRAVQALADAVLDYGFDFEGRDSRWLDFGFPLDYQSDLVELCEVLARLDYGLDQRLGHVLTPVLSARTADGRWVKQYGTRALQVEKRGQPSKWITIRALRALKHKQRILVQTEQVKLRNRPSWFNETPP